MLNASRALRVAKDHGAPLPEIEVLRPLYDMGVVLREGTLAMVAGRSSGGKSMLAQFIAAKMNVPTLYLAMDMGSHEAMPRLVASLSGTPVARVTEDMKDDDMIDYYQSEFLDECEVEFCFQENMSIEDVYLELDAYVEAYDRFPRLIIADNLMDLDAGDESYQGQVFIMQELRNLAKRTGAMVMVLAHTRTKDGDPGTHPQQKSEIMNKIDAKPQLILTLGREGDLFRIAVVKDRSSAATDPTAKRFITVQWCGDTASFQKIDPDFYKYSTGREL